MKKRALERPAGRYYDATDRFHAFVEVGPDCWTWNGHRLVSGHGRMQKDGSKVLAHRFAWELYRGPIPHGMCVCHHCDNPPCVNPAHLFLGTKGDNNSDRHRKGRSRGGRTGGKRSITEHDVTDIRSLKSFGASFADLARAYGVTSSCIESVVHRKTWRAVP